MFSETAKSLKPFKWEIEEYVAALMRLSTILQHTGILFWTHFFLFNSLYNSKK